jgi:hypothetical protein
MTLKLSPERADAVAKAIRAVTHKAHQAEQATDTVAARKAMNEVWFAVHDAQQLLNDAEKATRDEALAKVRTFA